MKIVAGICLLISGLVLFGGLVTYGGSETHWDMVIATILFAGGLLGIIGCLIVFVLMSLHNMILDERSISRRTPGPGGNP